MNLETIEAIKYIMSTIIYVSGLVVAYRETLKYLKLKAAEKSVGTTKVKAFEDRFGLVEKRLEGIELKADENGAEIKEVKSELKEVKSDLRELMSDIKDAFFGKK